LSAAQRLRGVFAEADTALRGAYGSGCRGNSYAGGLYQGYWGDPGVYDHCGGIGSSWPHRGFAGSSQNGFDGISNVGAARIRNRWSYPFGSYGNKYDFDDTVMSHAERDAERSRRNRYCQTVYATLPHHSHKYRTYGSDRSPRHKSSGSCSYSQFGDRKGSRTSSRYSDNDWDDWDDGHDDYGCDTKRPSHWFKSQKFRNDSRAKAYDDFDDDSIDDEWDFEDDLGFDFDEW
jgi:hypothetical protein